MDLEERPNCQLRPNWAQMIQMNKIHHKRTQKFHLIFQKILKFLNLKDLNNILIATMAQLVRQLRFLYANLDKLKCADKDVFYVQDIFLPLIIKGYVFPSLKRGTIGSNTPKRRHVDSNQRKTSVCLPCLVSEPKSIAIPTCT